MSYSEVNCQDTYTACQKLARGCYQSAILSGRHSLSGATLHGKAARYAGRYRQSAQNLIARCQSAGLTISERRGPHGKRILVIG